MSKPVNSSSTGRGRLDSPSGHKANLSNMAKHGAVKPPTPSKPPTTCPEQFPNNATLPYLSAVARGKAPLSPNTGFGKNVSVPSRKGAPPTPASKPIPGPAKSTALNRVATTPSRLKSSAQSSKAPVNTPTKVMTAVAPNQSVPGGNIIGIEVLHPVQNSVSSNAMPITDNSMPINSMPINSMPINSMPIHSMLINSMPSSSMPSQDGYTQELNVIKAEKIALQQEVTALNEELDIARGELTFALGDVKKLLDQNFYLTEDNTSLYIQQAVHVEQISALQTAVGEREKELKHERNRNIYAQKVLAQMQEREEDSNKIIEDYRKYGQLPGGDNMNSMEKMKKYREQARSMEIVAQMKTEKVSALENRLKELQQIAEKYDRSEEELKKSRFRIELLEAAADKRIKRD